jgi:hypothetical protein
MQAYRANGPPSPSNTELATFQVFSNSDYVDLGKLAERKAVVSAFADAVDSASVALPAEPAPFAAPESHEAYTRGNDHHEHEARRMSMGSSASQQRLVPSAGESNDYRGQFGGDVGGAFLGHTLHETHAEDEEDVVVDAQHELDAEQVLGQERVQVTPPRASGPAHYLVGGGGDSDSVFAAAVARELHASSAEPRRASPEPVPQRAAERWESESDAAREREDRAARSRRAFAAPTRGRYGPPSQYTREDAEEDDESGPEVVAEKEALLGELKSMEKLGTARLAREFTMADSLQALQFEYDRIQSDQSAVQTVEMAKGGIKMGVGVLEMLAKRFGLSAIDGWYNSACGDMGKYNRPLHKLYKKYWRRAPSSPISEIAYLILGSAAWTVVQNKVLGGGGGAAAAGMGSGFAAAAVPSAAAPSVPRQQGIQPSYEVPTQSSAALASASASASASVAAAPLRPMRPPQHASISGGSGWGSASSVVSASPSVKESDSAAQAQANAAAAEAAAAAARALETQRQQLAAESARIVREREGIEADRRALQQLEREVQASVKQQQMQQQQQEEEASEQESPVSRRSGGGSAASGGGARTLRLESTPSMTRRQRTSTAKRRALHGGVLKV